jgi:UDP-GlcNAc:undecaprenyl-phosphate/decaprenyl-phosphate GlcNAc-1-phosphate transferase
MVSAQSAFATSKRTRFRLRVLCYNRRMSFREALRALVGDGDAVWAFLCAAGIVLAMVPLIIRIAPRVGGIDEGGDRPRVHQAPIPRIGGIAMVIGILLPAAVFVHPTGPYLGILSGMVLVALVGLWDDIWGLRPITKFLWVCAVALVPVVGFDITVDGFSLPLLGNHEFGWAAYPITILWIATIANLVNLIDGIDALAAGIVCIAAFSFALLAASFGRSSTTVLAAAICGATLAFLRYNYPPARVFMGDSGALALGFLLATVAVEGVLKTAATIALVAPLLVLAVPILDTSFVVMKRLKYKRNPFAADQNHFYHRFMRIGFSQRRTAAYLHAWAGLVAAWAILLRFVPPRPGGNWDLENALICGLVGWLVIAASVWMVYTLEILKSRHLRALSFRRLPAEAGADDAVAVERALTGSRSSR